MLSVQTIYKYLGPKPASDCYSYVFNRIEDGSFKSIKSIKNYLKNIIKHSVYQDWIEHAKEIFLFIEENEK